MHSVFIWLIVPSANDYALIFFKTSPLAGKVSFPCKLVIQEENNREPVATGGCKTLYCSLYFKFTHLNFDK